jgi:hypothetical protein
VLAEKAAGIQRELSATLLVHVDDVNARLAGSGHEIPSCALSLASARAAIEQADQHLTSGDRPAAFQAARKATSPLGQCQRAQWEQAADALGPVTASPLAVCFGALPEHWTLVNAIRASSVGRNELAGGDFESLAALLDAGWRHYQHPQDGLTTGVELSPKQPHGGRFCLRMWVQPADPKSPPALVETPPLWITTAPIFFEPGTLVCIRGRDHVPQPITGSVDGLLVFDSYGGEPLAHRIKQTSSWQEFIMYRAATSHEPVTVTFAQTGIGEAWLDDVSISAVAPNLGATARVPFTRPR